MRVFKGFDNLPSFDGAVVTLGSFDGMHKGHLSLLDAVRTTVREQGGESVVLTFEPHPRVVLGRAEGLRLLNSMEEKVMLLESFGIDNLVIIKFDRDFSRIAYDEFVKRFLVEKIGVKSLIVGYNHHFGRGDEGTHSDLAKLSEECGFTLQRIEEWRNESGRSVSSTVLRQMVTRGDMEGVTELLSRPYIVIGKVDGDGRIWVADSLKLIPPAGLYDVLMDGKESQVRIDENAVMSCDKECGRVVIEFVRKIE
ncbi:MAG: FAD synthetase [Rikenellaceae bacterium]